MVEGKLLLLVGPSGSGKGTLLSFVRDTFPELVYPTSWTTRAPRAGEQEGLVKSGKAYHFVTNEDFAAAIQQGVFLEWDHHFHNYYGTPVKDVEEAFAEGKAVFQELEIRGVTQLLQKLPREQIKIIFVDAGSWDDLKKRALARGAISEEELEKRREHYEAECSFKNQADFILQNTDGRLEEAKEGLGKIIKSVLT